MGRKKMQQGICHLCKKKNDLSFEHIPPKVAFNSQTKYRSIPFMELIEKSFDTNYKPSGKIFQGGMGRYCLCKKCNSFLGNKYVSSYYIMASIGRYILYNYQPRSVEFKTHTLSPLKFLKQVISMFICINEPEFTDMNPELLEFVKYPEEKYLPEKFKVYMYLNNIGNARHIPIMYHNHLQMISEIAFPPLGFLLSIDNKVPIPLLYDITGLKNFTIDYEGELSFELKVLPTHIGYLAGDYRTQEDIDETVRKNLK